MTRRQVLRTARLRITTWAPSDLDDLASMHAEPQVMKFIGDGSPETVDRARERLREYLREQDEQGWTKWRVEDAGGAFVGRAGFGPYHNGREMGYSLNRSRWGAGLATELAEALVTWHRSNPIPGSPSLMAFAAADNHASRRVLEKVGFRFRDVHEHGGRPHAFYELLDTP